MQERRKEFGSVLALGLKTQAIFRTVDIEPIFLAGLGTLVGLAIALPSLLYLQNNPILTTDGSGLFMEQYGYQPLSSFKLTPLNVTASALTTIAQAIPVPLHPALWAGCGRPDHILQRV